MDNTVIICFCIVTIQNSCADMWQALAFWVLWRSWSSFFFYIFESLIYLKYKSRILDLFSNNSKSYERFNDVAFHGIFRTTDTSMLKNIQYTYVTM